MPLNISPQLKKAVTEEKGISRAEVEDYVWNNKPQACFLCGESLNRASDTIELDHNHPSSAGGTDEWSNLNLTHSSCNRYKRDHSSIEVRPHLRFKRFWEKQAGAVNFAAAKTFYGLSSSECYVEIDASKQLATVSTAAGVASVPIFREKVGTGALAFGFAELPISCVDNDDAIQPRNINLNHLLSIAADLNKNPLHEQPACRVVGEGSKKRILLFDGQHKAVAKMLNGEEFSVFKIYFDITEKQAIHLVNSIQSRIKKLPLTPFELASKMSDEVARQISIYEDAVGSAEVSEAGFIGWLDAADRNRAKQGIASAVIDSIISGEQLAFGKIIERKGISIQGPISLKEAAFQNNILKRLLYTKPLPSHFKGEAMKQAREREAANVIRLLNKIYDRGFVPQLDAEPGTETKRIERLAYQASLAYMSTIFRQLMSSLIYPTSEDVTFLEKDIKEDVWDRMAEFIDRFFSHPVWTGDLNSGPKARAVQDALSKNQNYETAFREVGLTGGYCAGQDPLPKHWAGSGS